MATMRSSDLEKSEWCVRAPRSAVSECFERGRKGHLGSPVETGGPPALRRERGAVRLPGYEGLRVGEDAEQLADSSLGDDL
jgi:hypothetical protein